MFCAEEPRESRWVFYMLDETKKGTLLKMWQGAFCKERRKSM